MIKKFLLATCAVGTLFAAADAKAGVFNGWSVGAFVGWERSNVEIELDGLPDFDESFNGIPVGLFVNWSKSSPNSWYFAAELGAGYGFTRGEKTIVNGTLTGANGASATGRVTYQLRKKLFVEFTPKLGWNFGQGIVYGLVSLKGTQTEHEVKFSGTLRDAQGNTVSGQQTLSTDDFLGAFGIGGGFDFKVSDCISTGLEYKYFFEKSAGAERGNYDTSYKMRSHNVTARLTYHF